MRLISRLLLGDRYSYSLPAFCQLCKLTFLKRNMLAIKYHHLRALIHRPYLCFPILRSAESPGSALTESNWSMVSLSERACISEARETARLLHSISSEMELVHDFPWWQMISCLICAGSILLVASIFLQQTDDKTDGLAADCLSDDAETCLRVFEALSTKSTGARIARDMMGKLKECGRMWSMFDILPSYPVPSY